MKKAFGLVLAVALFASPVVVSAEDIQSGLKVGQSIDAFFVTKIAGAADDGVSNGQNLCYRCKNGGRPQVMVFTRSADEQVVKLVQQLDESINKNSDKQLRAFVNFMAEDKAAAKTGAEKLATSTKAKNVPFVLPNEFENGPDNYGINSKAAITVIVAKGGKVEANYAAASAKDIKVDAVIAEVSKVLK